MAELSSGVEKSDTRTNGVDASQLSTWLDEQLGAAFADTKARLKEDLAAGMAQIDDGSFNNRSGRVLRTSAQVAQGETFFKADESTFAGSTPKEEFDPNVFAKTAEGGKLIRSGVVNLRGTPIATPYYVKDAPILGDGTYARAAYTIFGERALAYRIGGDDQFVVVPNVEIDSRASYEMDIMLKSIPIGAKNAAYGLGNLGLNLLDSVRSSFYQGNLYGPRLGTPDQFQAWGEPLPQMTFTDLLAGAYNVSLPGIAVNMGTGHPDLAGQGIGAGGVNLPFAIAPFGIATKMEFRAVDSVLTETAAWRGTCRAD